MSDKVNYRATITHKLIVPVSTLAQDFQ